MRKLLFFVAMILLFFSFKDTALASDPTNVRLSGKDRFAVAVNISKKGWPTSANTVVVANYMAFADALAASPLAYKENAPILLTHPNSLTSATKDEIKRLKPSKVIIVGGTGSVSSNVENELKSMNLSITRIGGKDRFEVSYKISQQLNSATTAIVANGLKFPDALTIAPYAARNGYPILLTQDNKIPDYTKMALDGKQNTIIVGGTGSVSDLVKAQLPNSLRIDGQNRFEVASNIARKYFPEVNKSYIATGLNFADALTGSVLAAKDNAPLLLTYPDRLADATKALSREKRIQNNVTLGGTASVQDVVISDLLPIANKHTIEGYSNKISVYPGETIELKVHSPNSSFSVDFIRYGSVENKLHSVTGIKGKAQHYYKEAYQIGALWDSSFTFRVPENWETGIYSAKVYDSSNSFYITFVVKDKNPSKDKIAVLASTNTWDAYNSWGGKSLYTSDKVTSFNQFVSFSRPNPGANPTGNMGHLANGEKHILSWLEKNNHDYDLLSDRDLHDNPAILQSYKSVIISTHSEYWTTPMYDGLESFLNKGGNVLYLSGNGVYWRSAIRGDQLEVRKNGSTHAFTNEKGGLHYQIGRPETAVIGVGYRHTGSSIPAPYKVLNSSHWVFANTSLSNGTLIGTKGLNTYRDSAGGASGWETDQMDRYTPSNAVLLAKGTNTTGAGADMIYYDHPGGGGVFSVGSITFGGSLAIDKDLTTIVNNVINRFKSN